MTRRIRWKNVTDDQLLDLRLKDLPVSLKGTSIERRIRRLYRELNERGIKFKPHVWLSEEFFTPDGVPGFAVPFYLAHPRLMRLERRQMLEVEGASEVQCMRILRHEAGHALDHAYGLHSRNSWRRVFGSAGVAYPESYKPVPNSRRHVLHLDAWYAQAHPLEDHAETFAVWLRPNSRWRSRYKGWPALRKLEYMDKLMKQIGQEPAKNKTRIHDEPLSQLSITLREHYRRKRERYSLEYPNFYDRDLRRLFQQTKNGARPTASIFLRKYRRELSTEVAEGTGVHRYTVDHVLKNMIERTKVLKMSLVGPERRAKRRAMILLTVHTMNIVHSGRYRFWYGV
jgi:hypothetical protein